MDVLSLDIISLDLVTHITHKHTQIPLFPSFFWAGILITTRRSRSHIIDIPLIFSLFYIHKMAASCHLSLVCVSKDIPDKQDEWWTEYIMADPFGWKIERRYNNIGITLKTCLSFWVAGKEKKRKPLNTSIIDGRLNSFYMSRGSLNISIRFPIREFCIYF